MRTNFGDTAPIVVYILSKGHTRLLSISLQLRYWNLVKNMFFASLNPDNL